jgi:uncharacterized protein (DUF1810 family)
MAFPIDLERFLSAQEGCYERVKREMTQGHKQSCWIWYIFPQILIKKTGVSSYHIRYAIHSLAEAEAYLNHEVLGARLRELSELVMTHPDTPIDTIMGWSLDAMKFNSSMTLFSLVSPPDSIFHRIIDHFFKGKPCPITMKRFGPAGADGEEDPDDSGSDPAVTLPRRTSSAPVPRARIARPAAACAPTCEEKSSGESADADQAPEKDTDKEDE